ncbi:MAG: caspase family protein [Pleurocapsa sp. MO_226.B13]|nr:caspase family protein [Pleurocapsa sp. MO_226.B13]
MGLDRRTFLQRAGLTLFTWGATEVGFSFLGQSNNRLATLIKNHQQTLAQPTNRKLALLVGINRYPHQDHLDGCLTDIEMQRELLIHRFGFNPQDILTLSDRAATRENIETAFIEHLIQQAEADDVVVFHFSGYGGQIKMPLSSEVATTENPNTVEYKLVNSLVPVDGLLTTKKAGASNSILQETLMVLAQSLSTAKCTLVLDTSFNLSPRAQHSNFKIRSATAVAESASPEELAFLEQLRSDLASKGLKPSKRLLSLPGVVFSAAGKNQVAVERHWDDFSAGLFTQALTQHLWQITPSSKVQVVLAQTAASVEQVMGRQQQPAINSPDKSAIAYYFAPSEVESATGVITKVIKNNFEVKLLGLPANILNSYGVGSCLNIISGDSLDSLPQLQIKSINGLLAKAQLIKIDNTEPVRVGNFLQESLRILERNLGLTLGLDADLERIERVDATSAIANITAINSTVVLGEQNADCLLGKVHHNSQTGKSEERSFSYGIYTAGGSLIGKTSGAANEAVKIAIERLQPHFNSLLAAKWLELTNNEFSSRLKVDVSLVGENSPIPILQKATFSSPNRQSAAKKLPFSSKNSLDSNLTSNVPILVKGSNLQLSLNNLGDRELYVLLLSIDTERNLFALYTPADERSSEAEAKLTNIVIAPGNELTIPQADNSWKWKVSDSIGINTLYTVFSVRPFTQTLKTLAAQENFKLDQQQFLNVVNPRATIESLMADLDTASSVPTELIANNDVYALDVNSWATLNFIYEVSNA